MAVRRALPGSEGEDRAAGSSAYSFFALVVYVTVDSLRGLLGAGEARPSSIGIGLAAASLVIMPLLSYAQRRAGRELGSASAVADSEHALLCTYLSAVLLAGLLLNTLPVGGGPTRSPPASSPPSPCGNVSTPGAATPAAPRPPRSARPPALTDTTATAATDHHRRNLF